MELKEAINARFSYRGNYAQKPVPREHLREIMEAGLAAPSGCNKQTVSLIGVDDAELLQKLLQCCAAKTKLLTHHIRKWVIS